MHFLFKKIFSQLRAAFVVKLIKIKSQKCEENDKCIYSEKKGRYQLSCKYKNGQLSFLLFIMKSYPSKIPTYLCISFAAWRPPSPVVTLAVHLIVHFIVSKSATAR